METVLQEVRRALDAQLYYAAIAMALAMPDICSALKTPGGDTRGKSRQLYCAWYEQNLAAKYPSITADDCWSMRNGVLHEGKFGRPGHGQYDRIVFVLPNSNAFHQCVSLGALVLDSAIFCEDVIVAVRAWLERVKGDNVVQANLPRLVQYRAQGLTPNFVGVPVVS